METEIDASQLRRLALLGLMTGDKVLAPASKAMLDDAAEHSKASTSRKLSIGNGFILDSATGTVSRDPGYAAYEGDRDKLEQEQRTALQADMLERLGYSADRRERAPRFAVQETEGGVVPVQTNPNAPGGAGAGNVIPVQRPISDTDRQKAAEAERLAREAQELYGEMERVRGVVSSPKDITTELISGIPGVGRGVARATQEGMYSPAQLSLKTRGARFEQNLSNLAAGLALTGYEILQRDRWSPYATGISQEESKRRLENIERDFGTRRDTIMNANQMQPAPSKRIRVDAQGNVIGN